MDTEFSSDDFCAFHDGIRAGDTKKVSAFIAAGMSPCAEVEGIPALFIAAVDGSPAMIDLLVKAGANPNQRMTATDGSPMSLRTALNGAASLGRLDCIERLLDHGANPRSLTDSKRTAGHILTIWLNGADAEQIEQADKVLQRMFNLGLPVNQLDDDFNTILHLAVDQDLPTEFLQMLLDRDADPYILNKEGHSPLHLSCIASRDEQFRTFIEYGADIERPNAEGQRPAHLCMYSNDVQAVFAAQPDLEARDIHGRTPLADAVHWASQHAGLNDALFNTFRSKAIKLFALGANVDAPDYEGITPRDIIKKHGIATLSEMLAARDARAGMERVAAAARKSTMSP